MPNVYEIVTERVIEGLKRGNIPWKRGWKTSGGFDTLGQPFPINAVSKKEYQGINRWMLCGWRIPVFATLKQWNDLGGSVKAGSRSSIAVFWKVGKKKVQDENGGIEEKKSFILRYYNVFNVEQTNLFETYAEKWNMKMSEKKAKMLEEAKANGISFITELDAIVKKHNPVLNYGGSRAFYCPSGDYIQLPAISDFKTTEAYYRTLLHELGHWTGHSSRLNRFGAKDEGSVFGSEIYSREELVAEMSSAFILAKTGYETTEVVENTQAYINHWIEKLKSDPKMIVVAASQAEKVVKYLLPEEEKADETPESVEEVE